MGGLPKLFEDIEKKDNKARTFAPPGKEEERLKNLATILKLESKEIPEDFDIGEIFRDEYLSINLDDVGKLVDKMKQNV